MDSSLLISLVLDLMDVFGLVLSMEQTSFLQDLWIYQQSSGFSWATAMAIAMGTFLCGYGGHLVFALHVRSNQTN